MGDGKAREQIMKLAAFFAMGGYGLYVWSAIGLTLVMVVFEIISLRRQYKKTWQRLKRIQQLRTAKTSGEHE